MGSPRFKSWSSVQDSTAPTTPSQNGSQDGIVDRMTGTALGQPDVDETQLTPEVVVPEPDPLARRFFNIRTLGSFLLGFALLALILPRMNVELSGIMARLSHANFAIYAFALVFYYLTFPVRAY